MRTEGQKKEKCCGAAVFTESPEGRMYLLVRSAKGVWGFPKGHMEAGETEEQTALREIREETGASVTLIGGFRGGDTYWLYQNGKPDSVKQVVYFLAECHETTFQTQDPGEITGIRLTDFDTAFNALQRDVLKTILKDADRFLDERQRKRCRERTAESLRQFDNHDPRLPYYELVLERELASLPEPALPAGYHLETYAPGDKDAWIRIEQSAKEFSTSAEGEQAWSRYYEGHEKELEGRMFFAVNDRNEKVATATAYYDIRKEDDGINGMLHWVAVRREDQGRGISKPLILHTLRRMQALGYRRAVIPTQTTTWLACKVYLDLGFRPIPRNAERNRAGWEIVRTLTRHPALRSFAETDVQQYLTKKDNDPNK